MKAIPIEGLIVQASKNDVIDLWQALFWSLTAVVILLTAGRFLICWHRLKKIPLDAIFNGVALLFLLAFMATRQIYVPIEYEAQLYDAGIQKDPPPSYDHIKARQIDSANVIFFWCTIYSVKASFLALYWQIFEISRRFRVAWTALATYIVLSFAISILSFLWHCGSPVSFINNAACRHWKSRAIQILYMTAALHVVGDVLLIALPVRMLKSIRMRRIEMISLGAIFALVLVDILFTILRVIFTVSSQFQAFPDKNTLWTILDPINITVLVCTLPSYRSLFHSNRKRPVVKIPDVSYDLSKFPGVSKPLSSGGDLKSLSTNGVEELKTYHFLGSDTASARFSDTANLVENKHRV